MKIDLFDYELPKELIAQSPAEARDASRLLVMHRGFDGIEHRHFSDLPEYLRSGDVLVINDSKVIKARLIGVKEETGARIEVFLVRKRGQANHLTISESKYDVQISAQYNNKQCAKDSNVEDWEVLVKPAKRVSRGQRVEFSDDFSCEIIEEASDGERIARFCFKGNFDENIDRLGKTPLPPYIHRAAESMDDERYQTVYAAVPGSLAAPTAGLHFTPELLKNIEAKGVIIAPLTLHVGLGTFRPVTVEDIENHNMHTEYYSISAETASKLNAAKMDGRRVICVGTTSARTLEGSAASNDSIDRFIVPSGDGETNIFIYPGYKFRVVDALITNFHLPKSTLLMLVSAFAGRERILDVYAEAIREGYRFFSYGDAMLVD